MPRKICQDGRVWGQNNKIAGNHLGILTGRKSTYVRKGPIGTHHWHTNSEFKQGHKAWNKGIKYPRMFGSNNPRWTGGWKNNLPRCIDCGKLLSHIKSKTYRCIKCSAILRNGNKNYNWKGGITTLYEAIRKLPEYKVWRNLVYQRDNYTCQKCFTTGCKLHAHHKKHFIVILKEFLAEYNQFSLFDDKEILLRLVITYKPFWEVNNGITYCEEHHYTSHTNCEDILCLP